MRQVISLMAKTLLAVLIVGGISAASAQAQYENGAIATIPFAFAAQRTNMAAGHYEIKLLSDPFLLAIRQAGVGRDFLLTVRPEESSSVPSHGYLVFRGGVDHLYLAEIHPEGTHSYSVVLQKHQPKTADVKIALNSSGSAASQ